ncbi:GNAT family N-acetyltransferase [Sporosarcina sp. P29]|uniref:GNAT family N-acetyltransferase n=1 Tax=Sporosarcina sp. P29 TaxID=2048252 RepID=UPI000C16ABCD|nr:GNAT family N-acetyltransferase [Sporosarcina sp. P29]PIC98770.1 GNAT family N-acetyltransferase [Sporosarcina sp. P29]
MSFLVREMVSEDIERVQDIARQSWHATYEGIIPRTIQDCFLDAAYDTPMMNRRLQTSNLFVVEVDDEVVGFADFSQVDEDGKSKLRAIYLYPDRQGKGLGSALIQKGIEVLGKLKELIVEVEKDNMIGRKFYEAKGFEVVKEYDDNFDGHTLKTIQMIRNL